MNDDLYFIPILARAMEDPDPEDAFRRAFEEILRLGLAPRYRRGLRQFELFLEEAARHSEAPRRESLDLGVVRALMAELVEDASVVNEETRCAILELLRSRPEWQSEYEQFRAEFAGGSGQPGYPDVLLRSEDGHVETLNFDAVPGEASISGIVPGTYELAFDTGRVIWAGRLTKADLVWSAAYPGRPLELAADTGSGRQPTTRELRLLGGEIILRVFPGIESGRIEVEIRAPSTP